MRPTQVLYTVLLLTPVAACSGKQKGPGTTDPYRDVAAFCAAWANAACNATVVTQCHAQSAKACQASQAAFCETLLPSSGYDSQNAQKCIDAVKAAYQDAALTRSEFATVRQLGTPCDQLVKGPGEAGAACTSRNDCNTLEGLDCVIKATPAGDAGTDAGTEAGTGGTSTGTCQKPVIVQGGLDCSQPEDVCVSGFYCDSSGASGTVGHCIGSGTAGKACSPTNPCGPNLDCQGPTGSQKCVAKAAENQNCSTDAECQDTLLCAPAASGQGVCVTQRQLSLGDPLCAQLR